MIECLSLLIYEPRSQAQNCSRLLPSTISLVHSDDSIYLILALKLLA